MHTHRHSRSSRMSKRWSRPCSLLSTKGARCLNASRACVALDCAFEKFPLMTIISARYTHTYKQQARYVYVCVCMCMYVCVRSCVPGCWSCAKTCLDPQFKDADVTPRIERELGVGQQPLEHGRLPLLRDVHVRLRFVQVCNDEQNFLCEVTLRVVLSRE